MAENLHNALRSMTIVDNDPIILTDDPSFQVFDENANSLLGRLLNPDNQVMARMIDYMPTAWRVYDRVRGIALSKDRFQFVFEREEDLLTVLKDRPWSYNHWAMTLERWTPAPTPDYLSTLEVWVRIRNIPVNYFTAQTMFTLASKLGKVEEIAYDPKRSQKTEYVRAKVTMKADNPFLPAKNLNLPTGDVVVIEFEYEKLHKKCFGCHRLTHEKTRCPWHKNRHDIPKGDSAMMQTKARTSFHATDKEELRPESYKAKETSVAAPEAPPGFPVMFPELPEEERKMAIQYVSHSNETERNARILRVKQSIEEARTNLSVNLLKITHDIDKEKGHVFDYDTMSRRLQWPGTRSGKQILSEPVMSTQSEQIGTSSPSLSYNSDVQLRGSTGFSMGTVKSSYSGSSTVGKKNRKRPHSWLRKTRPAPTSTPRQLSRVTEDQIGQDSLTKEKLKTHSLL